MLRKWLVCGVFLLLSPVYVLPNPEPNKTSENFIPCEEGWYYFGEKCYKIGGYGNDDHVTWEESSTRCREFGEELASIHSKEQNDFFSAFLALNMKQIPWIGLNDLDNESVFIWEDGSPVNYQNWEAGQPDNYWKYTEVTRIFLKKYPKPERYLDIMYDDDVERRTF